MFKGLDKDKVRRFKKYFKKHQINWAIKNFQTKEFNEVALELTNRFEPEDLTEMIIEAYVQIYQNEGFETVMARLKELPPLSEPFKLTKRAIVVIVAATLLFTSTLTLVVANPELINKFITLVKTNVYSILNIPLDTDDKDSEVKEVLNEIGEIVEANSEELSLLEGDSQFYISINLTPEFVHGSLNPGNLMIDNVKENTLDIVVHLKDALTDEIIYVSPRLSPGDTIEQAPLLKEYEEGFHTIKVEYTLYNGDSTAPYGNISYDLEMKIYVHPKVESSKYTKKENLNS